MADIYLGTDTSGGAILLPPIRWINGSDPGLPTDHSKKIDRAEMLDGSWRHNFRDKQPRSWTLEWAALTPAELAPIAALNDEHSRLWFQNNWESTEWRRVVILDFRPEPSLKNGRVACRFSLVMTLEESG